MQKTLFTFKYDTCRKAMIRNMSKKLAKPKMELVDAKKKKDYYLLYMLPGVFILFLGLWGLFLSLHNEQFSNSDSSEIKNSQKRIFDSYSRCDISIDQYAGFLCDLLVRYDSLPVRFRARDGVVNTEEVLDTLAVLWPGLGSSAKRKVLADIPAMRDLEPVSSDLRLVKGL